MIYHGILTVVEIRRSEMTRKLQIHTWKYPATPEMYDMPSKVTYRPNFWRAYAQEGVKISRVIRTLKNMLKKERLKEIEKHIQFMSELESLSE